MQRLACLFWFLVLLPAGLAADDWFDCVLPGDDGAPTLTSWASLNGPIGVPLGRVSVSGARFTDPAGNRVRFLGTNMSVLPPPGAEAAVAGRLAKFGFNIVRFHHLDADWNDNLFHTAWGKRAVELDPGFLERYDRTRAAFAEKGIYSNVNLITGRSFKAADGLPRAVDQIDDWKVRQSLGFWYAPILDLQKDFARRLLLHKSVVNGLTLAEDPSVAIVEINNENGLVQTWLSGSFDTIPEELMKPLADQWNRWILNRFPSRQALIDGMGFSTIRDNVPLVSEATHPLAGWNVEAHGSAEVYKASRPGPAKAPGLRIDIVKKSTEGWHVQLNLPGLTLAAGQSYHLSFLARADHPRQIDAALMMAHEPWQALAPGTTVDLTGEWKRYEVYFSVPTGDPNARINFGDMGRDLGWVEVSGVTLATGGQALGEDQDPVRGTLALVPRGGGGYPRAYLDEWTRFLAQTERAYWEGMQDYLVHDLGVKSVVVPTILGCTTPEILASFPVMDAHAYWNHPVFPGTPWDAKNWYVTNSALVKAPNGGTLGALALYRVEGKPFTVSEYDHPFPNTFGSESYPLLGAYAALQDWDGIYSFAYDPVERSGRFPQRVMSYFEQAGNPVKMAGMLLAAGVFRRADVAVARESVVVGRNADAGLARLSVASAWSLGSGRDQGLDPRTALIHRVGQSLSGPDLLPEPARGPLESDTGQLAWNPTLGQVVVDSPLTKIATGFLAGRTVSWSDGIVLVPSGTATDHATWGLTVKEGTSFSAPQVRILVTGLGAVRNRGQVTSFYGGERTDTPPEGAAITTQPDFGVGPVQMKGVAASLGLPLEGRTARAWVLDLRGSRLRPLTVTEREGRAWVTFSPAERALWYEIELR